MMIAYHFPPMAGSSGIQRTLRFALGLPKYGWEASVLTAHHRAYDRTNTDLLHMLPPNLKVVRSFALDARRHLSLFGKYPAWVARPDRWVTWLLGALASGLLMIRQRRPEVLWSTYPIATAHLIGYWLARISGVPWVADFRDPMAHDGYPTDSKTWNSYLAVEQRVFSLARAAVFATPGAARLYQQRYASSATQVGQIANGYDEASFVDAEHRAAASGRRALNPGRITLLHSGVVYPEWRDPSAMFAAIRQLLDHGELDPSALRLRFRAAEHEDFVAHLAAMHSLGDMVELLPPVDYEQALAEMLCADGLFVLQSKGCNDQVPAKLYEYFRTGVPILALTDPSGDTAGAMRNAGLPHVAALEASAEIAPTLARFLDAIRDRSAPVAHAESVRACSRDEHTRQLAELFDKIRRPR